MEGLSLLKPGQRLANVGTRSFFIGRGPVALHGFRQTGQGILPTEYWLDENRRLLCVTNCNRLWRSGTRFQQSYCTDPICSPARSSIFTGRMPSETGVFRNGLPIIEGIPNLGQWIGAHTSYEIVYIGKWHLPEPHTYAIPGFNVLGGIGVDHRGDESDALVSRAAEAYLLNRTAATPFLLSVSLLHPHDICDWCRLHLLHAEHPLPEIEGKLPPLPANFGHGPAEPEIFPLLREALEPTLGGWTPTDWQYYLWSYYRMVERVDDRALGRHER